MHPDLNSLDILDEISLYLHVPFCPSKCDYCDFFSKAEVPGEVQHRVIEETINQAEILLERIGRPRVGTIFIGGGTPTSLGPALLEKLVTSLQSLSRGDCKEFTCEANPESISRDALTILQKGGVTRLSLGVQSFHKKTLSSLGRHTAGDEIRRSLELIRQLWAGELNIDLITHVPEQSIKLCLKDAENAVQYEPDHLSVYSLQIEEGTPLYNRLKSAGRDTSPQDLPTDMLSSYLNDRAFRRYEISNYSRPGKECRHNLAYWRMRPYLGCGPGAVSTLPGKNGIVRLENPKDIEQFLKGQESSWGVHRENIHPPAFLMDYCMMGLRLTDGIELKEMERVFGIQVVSSLMPLLQGWENEGNADLTEGRIRLTPGGMDIMNPLLIQLMDTIEHLYVDSVQWP
jgi:oxygen-independent coproporphyrinogen-3 oxidase